VVAAGDPLGLASLSLDWWNWGSKLSDLKRIMELLGPEYVAVTPSQLHTLYQQAHSTQR
jgi:hypothetical protein